tara:strand:- start:1368 stop:1670 length:303 start_codon:yes stop_codon:yes gene_type:complete
MPVYLFKTAEGLEVESFFTANEAPKIGDTVEINGMECTRVPSFVLDSAGINRKTHQYPYVSRALPRNMPGVENYDKQGRPIIKSQQHERNVAAQHDMIKE